jgi:hypothetical protein
MTAREEYLDQMRHSMKEIAKKYYDNQPVSTPVQEAPVHPPRPTTVEKFTKSPATLVADGTPVQPKIQAITKPENVIDVPKPTMSKAVAEMIGNTFNGGVKVLSYNASESLIPRGEKQKPLPHVDCECLKCGTKFVVNAYRVSGGSQKSCGCDSKRKAK